MKETPKLTIEDFESVSSNQELLKIIKEKNIPFDKVAKRLFYEEELRKLQIELVKLQQWISYHWK